MYLKLKDPWPPRKQPLLFHSTFFSLSFPFYFLKTNQLNTSTFNFGLAHSFYFPENNHWKNWLLLLHRVIQAYYVSWRAVIRSYHHLHWLKEFMVISWPQTTGKNINKLCQKCLNSEPSRHGNGDNLIMSLSGLVDCYLAAGQDLIYLSLL